MTALKCKKCGVVGYSAAESARCECGGQCEVLTNGASAEKKKLSLKERS